VSLTLVPDDTGDAAFLASAKVKSSGVHIGAGVYLSHNHNPYAANTSSATPHRGLDGEAAEATPTTAYDFTLPDDPAAWDPYWDSEARYWAVSGFDVSLHVGATTYDGPSAPLLIANDPSDLYGTVTVTGYPSGSNDPFVTDPAMVDDLCHDRTELPGGLAHFATSVDGDAGGYLALPGVAVAGGMSGGGVFIQFDADGDGAGETYVIGTLFARANFGTLAYATSIAPHYHDLAAALAADGSRDADDFEQRMVLLSGQDAADDHSVLGTFLNEALYGSFYADILSGADGDDVLEGAAGDDTLDGGQGSDTLDGGAGDDLLVGGGGADVFVLGTGGNDRIGDFALGEDSLLFRDVTLTGVDMAEDGRQLTLSDGSVVVLDGLARNDAPEHDAAGFAAPAEGTALDAAWLAVSDADGLGDLDYARAAWWRDGSLVHTGQVYTPGQGDVGGTLTLTLGYTDGFLTVETVEVTTGAVANVNDLPGHDPSGFAAPVEAVALDAAGLAVNDADGLGDLDYARAEWWRDGTLVHTGRFYTPGQADVGGMLTLTLAYTDGFLTDETVEVTTGAVANVNDLPGHDAAGFATPAEGTALDAAGLAVNDADGLGDLDYARAEWWRGGTLVHTGRFYTPGQADVGGTLTLTLAYTDGFLTDETVTVATGAVANVNDLPGHDAAGFATPAEGTALDAAWLAVSDADGLGDLDYARAAWWRDATLVHTGQVYTPGQTDVGGTLTLTLAYTDGFLTDETVTVATGAVADDPTTICGTPGNDSLCGTAGNDTISGDGGADMLDGLDGADTLFGGAGDDTMFGGAGDDLLVGDEGDDFLWAGSGSDVILAGAGNDVIYAGFGADPDDPFADGLWWPGPAVPEGDLLIG
jgi:Ca2+-binding RTX toxin-like protein